jgi:UDP-N-acetylmuramoyl-L-alanyl-D-glutamate--2,6-diaminopimelate ligase
MRDRALPGRPRTVQDLASLAGGTLRDADPRAALEGLSDDSRAVRRGEAFFARHGSKADGALYAKEAVRNGCSVVVTERPLSPGVPSLLVPDVAEALLAAADAWYGRPQDALDLVGITGTKGKTTTAWLAASAIRHGGRKAAVLGTISHDLGDGRPVPAENTTPGALELRRLLAVARDAGCTAAVMEVSSHALDQGRTAGLDFRAAVFTNLASDHLDYHEDLESYFQAKARLFSGLGPSGTAVLNREDPAWPRLAALCLGPVVTYGAVPEADLRADRIALSAERTQFRLVVGGDGETDVTTTLVGRHNVMNLLAAVGAAAALGIDPVIAAEGASHLKGVRGRLERVGSSGDLHAFVDYAHTEDALRQVLTFLANVGAQPLTCVIGCGGDRDRTKRPKMARVAAELAHRAILTSDNPRTEDPNAILAEMTAGLSPELLAKTLVVPDRREAIRRAVLEAFPGSSVLVAGKGHEDYQVVGTRKLPFDDATEVREALRLRETAVAEGATPWGAPRA